MKHESRMESLMMLLIGAVWINNADALLGIVTGIVFCGIGALWGFLPQHESAAYHIRFRR